MQNIKRFQKEVGYRAADYSAPTNCSALDVFRYETEELGNAYFLRDFDESGLTLEQLAKLNSADVIWVCTSKDDASRYDSEGLFEVYEVGNLKDCAIICEDQDEGFLVVQPWGMVKLGLTIEQEAAPRRAANSSESFKP